MDLSQLRRQIDALDTKLVTEVAARMQVAAQIAALKRSQGMEIFQPEREVELLQARKQWAKELGVSEELITEIFRLLMQESRKVQKRVLKEKSKIFPTNLRFHQKTLDAQHMSLREIFQRVAAETDYFFFLESLGEDEWSEYSFLGFSPATILEARGDDFFIDGKKTENSAQKTPLQQLEEFFAPLSYITTDKSFRGGLVGYFGTESARYFDPAISCCSGDIDVSTAHQQFPDFCLGLFLDGLIYDRKRHTLEYFYWDEDRSEVIEQILSIETGRDRSLQVKPIENISTDQEFEYIVEHMKEEIVAGNIYQGVPSRHFKYKIQGSLVPFYLRLREVNPSPHMYFLHFGEMQIIGSSPELVARVSGERIETFPIAGTRSRGQTPKEDAQKAAELLSDEKEVAEHMMLVDMARNDLGRVCKHGSVQVDRLMSIKKFSHVQHIVSEVSGILKKDVSALRGMMANFPMGTVCGSPRIEAMKIIRCEEKFPRGPYGGAVGFWSFSGDATFALLIRTLFVYGEEAFVQAGAGVVYDSVAEYERREVEKKMEALRGILEEFTGS